MAISIRQGMTYSGQLVCVLSLRMSCGEGWCPVRTGLRISCGFAFSCGFCCRGGTSTFTSSLPSVLDEDDCRDWLPPPFVFFLSVHWFCLANLSAAVVMSGLSGPVGLSLPVLASGDSTFFTRGRSMTRSGVCFCRNSQRSFPTVDADWLIWLCELALRCQSSRFWLNDGSSSLTPFSLCITSPTLWLFQWVFFARSMMAFGSFAATSSLGKGLIVDDSSSSALNSCSSLAESFPESRLLQLSV